jgi:hemerythrin-like domain-containing protein
MTILDKLNEEHNRILAALDALMRQMITLDPPALPALVHHLWDLVSDVEAHEEFEEQKLLTPLSVGVVDVEVARRVEEMRRDHERVFDLLAGLHELLGRHRTRPAALWTEQSGLEIRQAARAAFDELRGHIRRENACFHSIAAALDLIEKAAVSDDKRPPHPSRS